MSGARVLAVKISSHGGPDELMLVERPDPQAAAGRVVVRNRWIGVNYVDLQHRAGQPYPVRLPLIPGTEAAGTVVAVGAGADPGLVGTPVVHFGHLGGVYAEMTAVPAEFVVPLAADVALDAAAAVAMNGTTAYVLTSMACRIGPGDVVVVQAARRPVRPRPALRHHRHGPRRGLPRRFPRWACLDHRPVPAVGKPVQFDLGTAGAEPASAVVSRYLIS
jgi:D-arabinose 1-dehydrogenase-like Zn-dependent alcohol dehydrogenase